MVGACVMSTMVDMSTYEEMLETERSLVGEVVGDFSGATTFEPLLESGCCTVCVVVFVSVEV